jgi:hypothetical protein
MLNFLRENFFNSLWLVIAATLIVEGLDLRGWRRYVFMLGVLMLWTPIIPA